MALGLGAPAWSPQTERRSSTAICLSPTCPWTPISAFWNGTNRPLSSYSSLGDKMWNTWCGALHISASYPHSHNFPFSSCDFAFLPGSHSLAGYSCPVYIDFLNMLTCLFPQDIASHFIHGLPHSVTSHPLVFAIAADEEWGLCSACRRRDSECSRNSVKLYLMSIWSPLGVIY